MTHDKPSFQIRPTSCNWSSEEDEQFGLYKWGPQKSRKSFISLEFFENMSKFVIYQQQKFDLLANLDILEMMNGLDLNCGGQKNKKQKNWKKTAHLKLTMRGIVAAHQRLSVGARTRKTQSGEGRKQEISSFGSFLGFKKILSGFLCSNQHGFSSESRKTGKPERISLRGCLPNVLKNERGYFISKTYLLLQN